MIKTITYTPDTHALVPIEPSDEMLRKAIKIDLGKDCDEKGICINLYQVMLAGVRLERRVSRIPTNMAHKEMRNEISQEACSD